jgi:predicted RNase H-like nuclease (RuvC/YqgF family)
LVVRTGPAVHSSRLNECCFASKRKYGSTWTKIDKERIKDAAINGSSINQLLSSAKRRQVGKKNDGRIDIV